MDAKNTRVLIVDDNPDIHKDFLKILKKSYLSRLDDLQRMLFRSSDTDKTSDFQKLNIDLDFALQGQEAYQLVQKALEKNQPYSLAFIDVRMPPGWDGINTIKEIWKIDPSIQVVLCTAYSDYSWEKMFNELQGSDNFLILKKPFDKVEVKQLVASLTKKWEYKRRVDDKVLNLESAISERTSEAGYAMQLAEEANRVKSTFLKNISHELRTPLNAITGFTELLFQDKIDQRNVKECYSDILSSAKYLSEMINDMLDISELEEEFKINIKPVDTYSLIDDIKDIFSSLLKEKDLEWIVEVDPMLEKLNTDKKIIKQVLRHYISNAIKFNTKHGKIKIYFTPIENNKFKIEVIDTGVGIHEEDIGKLFTPFQQLDMELGKRYPGSGIGLALTKRMVELAGGSVGVTSRYGEGSHFYAILPLHH